ncbi:MAG: hypothetical protein H6Q33_5314 [Deltaproteobacteria bacterium]|nr:hypothetical protein [Deltaproteobacteria bacterium]
MEQLWAAIRYVVDHPALGVAAAIGIGLVFYLLNRKPRLTREAEDRFKQIRKERGDQYHHLRPPR